MYTRIIETDNHKDACYIPSERQRRFDNAVADAFCADGEFVIEAFIANRWVIVERHWGDHTAACVYANAFASQHNVETQWNFTEEV